MFSRLIKSRLFILVLLLAFVGLLVAKTSYSEAHTEVCFCHNVNHNPHTICTSNQGLINGHMNHVRNGEDTLGPCPQPSPTPTLCEPDCHDCPFDLGGCNQPPIECCGSPFCLNGLTVYGGVCRNPDCPEEEGCQCPEEIPTPTPTETMPSPTPTPTTPPSEGGPSGPSGNAGGPWSCGATIPGAPTLLSATKSGGNTALVWTAVNPVTHYSLAYGLTSGDYPYGLSNTGNVTSYTVGGLDPAADYCFVVRAVNDCAPSDPSNEICTGRVLGAGQVLGATTLAATGSFSENLLYLLFIMGSVCSGLGLRLLLPAKKLA
jgi:hypothetical protein